MSYQSFNHSAPDLFGNFSAIDEVHPSYSPGPVGASTHLAAQQSDTLREEPRVSDAQNSTESFEKTMIRLMQQMVNLELDRGQRQAHESKIASRQHETVKERLDTIATSQEILRRQITDALTQLKNLSRYMEQLLSSKNPTFLHGAPSDSFPMPGHVPYAPAVRRQDQLSLPGTMPSDRQLFQDFLGLLQRHRN